MVQLSQRRVTCSMGSFPVKALHVFHPQIQEDEIVVEVAPSSCLVYVRDIFQEVVAVKEALSHHDLQMLMSAFGYLSGKVECPHFNLDSKADKMRTSEPKVCYSSSHTNTMEPPFNVPCFKICIGKYNSYAAWFKIIVINYTDDLIVGCKIMFKNIVFAYFKYHKFQA